MVLEYNDKKNFKQFNNDTYKVRGQHGFITKQNQAGRRKRGRIKHPMVCGEWELHS
jgi:hypothetical protein